MDFLNPSWARIAIEELIAGCEEFFERETGPDGKRWSPLSAATLAARKHGGSKILTDSARLRRSIAGKQLGDDAVVIGTNVAYGKYHDSDDPRGSNLPQRKFLGATEETLQIIADEIGANLSDGAGRHIVSIFDGVGK